MDSGIKKYRELVEECDSMSERLASIHSKHMQCRRGCNSCCVNLNVFPVEFYSILDNLSREGLELSFDESGECGFIDENGGCRLYKYRPIICRTHGLPIVFHEEQDGQMVGNVSFCDMNFRDIDESFVFDKYNTLNIDAVNDKFFAVNLEFITNNPELGFDITTRIPLRQLMDFVVD
jgi:Fe-S-cluster containining protein